MPPRLLLDGEDLRSLMLRVRDEMGPGARIVKAERIRTGGVGGFFARERYELTVEVPEAAPPARPGAVVPRPAAPGDVAGPVGLDALLAAAEAQERSAAGAPTPGGPADPPAVSTTGDTFAQVLESMQSIVGPPAPAADPAPPPRPEPGGTTADLVVAAEGDAPAATDLVAPAAPSDPDRSGSSVASLLELGIPARLLSGFADPDAPVPLSRMVRRFEPAPVARLARGNVVALVGDAAAALRTATQMAHRAGLEQRDVALAGDADLGTGHGRRLQTRNAVARYRSRVSGEALYLVVVGVPREPERWAESAELLDALAPDQAWAVVDARRKAVELRRWLRVVGGSRGFDAVAASGTFDAQAPGTVLNLGVPVGWIDGLPASPLVWAAILSERLADDARWD